MSDADNNEKIEELAALQFHIEEIALILEIDPAEFTSESKKRAYMRGRLKAEAEIRKSIFQMAKQGSSPAQKQMLDIIEKNRKSPFPAPPPEDSGFDLGVEL